jgi:hypothetical protein
VTRPERVATPLDGVLQADIDHCARCGKPHKGPLAWRQFQRPVELDLGEFRYWTTCPNTQEPIMLWVAKDPDPGKATAPIRKPVA